MERTGRFTCHLDKGRVRPTRFQPADGHYWRGHGGRCIPHRVAFDHRGHSELHQAERARGTWLESRFRWQIRTFWFGLLWISLCVGFIVMTLGIGHFFMWLPITLVGLWFVYRIVRGWVTLSDGRPMYV